jgi:BirA family transcriptional regulator, biotin operon repressor / biotin---[acetyl-CoA-carboxylase] ligase
MTFIWLDHTDSTNSQVRLYAQRHQPAGPVAMAAGQQTAGRGTQGRIWASPAGCGLYLSLWLPTMFTPYQLLTQRTGGLVCNWLAAQGWQDPALGLKPINDVMCGPRKLGGILVETTVTGDTAGPVIVGVGLNVNTPVTVPAGYPDTAMALDALTTTPLMPLTVKTMATQLAQALTTGLALPVNQVMPAYHHWVSQWHVASQPCLR